MHSESPSHQRPPRPSKIEPRGLRRLDAAAYVGVSPSQFDAWIHQKIMPKPKKIGGVAVWDRLRLDAAFEALPGDEDERHSVYDDLVT